ncbi:hypothetical protein AURDEDRAFT_112588, partial [Auricularia subglabra TFB-10046 SS5]
MPAGALIAFVEPGAHTSVEEFKEIFAKEHLPPVMALPQFTRGAAYRTADGSVPSWGAVFELSDIGVLQTGAVRKEDSERERAVMADLAAVDRRVLLLLSDRRSDEAGGNEAEEGAGERTAEVEVGRAIALVGLNAGVGAWVLDGHNALVEGVPGWARTRTFRLVHAVTKGEGRPTAQLVALHEFVRAEALESVEFREAAPRDHAELQVRTAVQYQVI